MGSYRDEHLIIECSNLKVINEFRKIIIDLMKQHFEDSEDTIPDYGNYVSPVLVSLMGGGIYFLFIPADCSKEGWTVSTVMDDVREVIRSKAIYLNALQTDCQKKISIIKVTDDKNDAFAEYELKGNVNDDS